MNTTAQGTISIASLRPGQELPRHEIFLTRSFIIATAIASRDYEDVHHDPELAVKRGSKDIFMNILTTNGLVEKYVRSWAGPGVLVRRIKVRLGVPNYPDDTLTFTGSVTSADCEHAEISVLGTNSLGTHVTGIVTLGTLEDSQ